MLGKDTIKPKYLQKNEYLAVKGIDLDFELVSGDDDANNADRFISRIENKVLNYLSSNYDFDKSMIGSANLDFFKLGLCDQIEWELAKGIDAVICESALQWFRTAGLCNLMRY